MNHVITIVATLIGLTVLQIEPVDQPDWMVWVTMILLAFSILWGAHCLDQIGRSHEEDEHRDNSIG